MLTQNKSEYDLLRTVAGQPYELCKPEWSRLLRALHLAPSYVPAIQEVLRDSRWRERSNPVGYVRNGAVRQAVRMGLVDLRRKSNKEVLASELNYTDGDGRPMNHDDKLGLALYAFDTGPRERPIVDCLPAEIVDEFHEEVNWEKVADLADLDAGERIVLELRLMGLGWRDAIAACLTADDRAILHSAWRRFDRHKDVLKQVLLTAKPHRAKRIARGPEVEMMFTETEEGRLKIFFRKVVSK